MTIVSSGELDCLLLAIPFGQLISEAQPRKAISSENELAVCSAPIITDSACR